MVSFGIIGAAAGLSWGTTIFHLIAAPMISQKSVDTVIPVRRGWVQYSNEAYGFEFQYPQDLMDVSAENNSWITLKTKYRMPVTNWG